ncbi:MAG: sulfatase-like hydrolase/transferase, partial [Candidatus Eisenbacteria sp.]|nr:sulfatase-like hydrolase/transferase [Candidatus Eisenbacteria bacterium]
ILLTRSSGTLQEPKPLTLHETGASPIRDLARAWLIGRQDAPFFLFLNFMDAHTPYLPPQEYRARFGSKGPEIEWIGFPDDLYTAALFDGRPMPKKDVAYALSQYDAALAYLDGQVSRLIQDLKDLGLFEETLIVIVSDHGEAFWEHGVMEHGSTLYDPQVRVPLLIKLPAAALGDSMAPSAYMQHVDFLPTIAEVLQIEPPPGVQGSAWGRGRDYALAENYVHWGRPARFHHELVAVESQRLKYVYSTAGVEEVFDPANDPQEVQNLFDAMPEFVTRMREIRKVRDLWLRDSLIKQQPDREDERMREKLRSLGYL